jgi:hypothetical protein
MPNAGLTLVPFLLLRLATEKGRFAPGGIVVVVWVGFGRGRLITRVKIAYQSPVPLFWLYGHSLCPSSCPRLLRLAFVEFHRAFRIPRLSEG